MAESSQSSQTKNESIEKKNDSTIIRYGLISQGKSCTNIYNIMKSYLKTPKIKEYIIKDEYNYEFTLESLPQLIISMNDLKELENLFKKYSIFNFFMIFIDIQSSKSLDFLETTIDTIIDAGESDNNIKKCYIFGFYSKDNAKMVPEENITTILDAKGIEYYYCSLKNDENNKFEYLIESIINDSNTIMIEKFLDLKNSELIIDHSKSHCNIF